jgi:hypothetical protein
MAQNDTVKNGAVIASAKNKQIQAGDGRAQWERPALRRLTASEAEASASGNIESTTHS